MIVILLLDIGLRSNYGLSRVAAAEQRRNDRHQNGRDENLSDED